MQKPRAISRCSLPVASNVCFNLGPHLVTAQPIYEGTPPINPYVAIAKAGVRTVLCVRDPQEVNTSPYPFDLTESSQLILNNVEYTNIPLPHIPMSQAEFNLQAFYAESVMNTWKPPVLIHCSTGDRASAAFAIHLILRMRWPNDKAAEFAQKELALQNPQFIQYVQKFSVPGTAQRRKKTVRPPAEK